MAQPDETDIEQDIVDIRRRANEVQEAIDKVRGKADGVNGAVEVTVDARGRLQSLRLTPQALRLNADELAAHIVACANSAVDKSEAAVHAASKPFTDDLRIREALDAIKSFDAETDPAKFSAKAVSDDAYFDALNEDPLRRRS